MAKSYTVQYTSSRQTFYVLALITAVTAAKAIATVSRWIPTNVKLEQIGPDLSKNFTPYNGAGFSAHLGCGSIPDLKSSSLKYKNVSFFEGEPNPDTTYRLPQFDNIDGKGLVATFNNAFVAGAWSMVFNCNTKFVAGGCRASAAQFPDSILTTPSPHPTRKIDNAVLLSQFWGENYYHWLVEDFLRLALVYEYLVKHSHVKLIMYNVPAAAALTSLIGIDPDRIVPYADSGMLYFVKKLAVPSGTACGAASGPAAQYMRHIFRRNAARTYPQLHAEDKKKNVTVLVQRRQKGTARSLINHVEMMEKLGDAFPRSHFIEFLENDNITVSVIKHFHADLIIGPHGAGLSNVVFAPSHVTLLELHPYLGNHPGLEENAVNLCHQTTARRLGVNATFVIEDNGTYNTPFKVNIERLIRRIRRIELMLSANSKHVSRFH